MRLVLESKRVYNIIAIAMLVIGGSMIASVIATELSPRNLPGCNVLPPPGPECSDVPTNEPSLDDYFPSNSNFIFLAGGISLVAFGGSILGMVLRLGA